MLNRLSLSAFCGACAIWWSVMPVHAACPTLSLDEEFARSTAVFTGRAVAQSVTTRPAPSLPYTEITFAVETLWKGTPDKTIQIQTCGGVLGDTDYGCVYGFRFVVGSRYVVFAMGTTPETSTCQHTELLNRATAKATLQWLSKKSPIKIVDRQDD